MKTTPVKIGKRTFALAFTLDAMAAMMDLINDFDLNQVSSYVKSPKSLIDMVYCMAQQGEYLEGRTLDVDRAWLGAHMSPAPVRAYKIQVACLNALADGLAMETDDDESGEVDVVLDEIKKNANTEN